MVGTLKTHEDVLEVAKQIRSKQRGEKANAMARLIEAYDILARHKKEGVKYYTIVEDVGCAKCGGVILKQVHPLGMITPGGSPITGCPKCKTFSYKHDRSEFVKLVVKEKYMIRFTDAVGESDKIFTTAISKEEAEEWFNEQFPTCIIVEVEIKQEIKK